MIEVAMAAGYGSVRRFNDHVKKYTEERPVRCVSTRWPVKQAVC